MCSHPGAAGVIKALGVRFTPEDTCHSVKLSWWKITKNTLKVTLENEPVAHSGEAIALWFHQGNVGLSDLWRGTLVPTHQMYPSTSQTGLWLSVLL